MPLFITSLNSGSNGNCYYVANDNAAVLIDVGISCREVEKRMARLRLSLQKIKAVFISHEHSDHIKGVQVFSKKYNLPVYITETTYNNSGLNLDKELIKWFQPYIPVNIKDLTITGFPKIHDAVEPQSFIIKGSGIQIGVFTDIGAPCENVIRYFKNCHAAFLEANYDEEMLESGNYPIYLKNRIRGGKGHLSNKEALSIFLENRSDALSHLFLSHLSKDNNCPDLVYDLFTKHAGKSDIIVASRYNETPVYSIYNNKLPELKRRHKNPVGHSAQLALF